MLVTLQQKGDAIVVPVALENWYPQYFHLLPASIEFTTAAAIDEYIAGPPPPPLMAPLGNADTGVTTIQVWHTIYT